MGSSRFALFALMRVALLGVTLWAAAALIANTSWYATTLIVIGAVIYQWLGLLSFVNTSNREIGRLLTAIEYEDLTQTFSDRGLGGTFRELAAGLTRVVDKLRATRKDREEQAHYLRTLVEHIPVALLAVEDGGRVSVLNSAARRLLGGGRFEKLGDLAVFGDDFARMLTELEPGRTVPTPSLQSPVWCVQPEGHVPNAVRDGSGHCAAVLPCFPAMPSSSSAS